MTNSQLRRDTIRAIQRSGAVLQDVREEQRRIRETLERSDEMDRQRGRFRLSRAASRRSSA